MKRPSTHSPLKTFLQVSALAAALLCSAFSSAELLNGDFSSGFDNWQGEVTSGDPGTTTAVNPSAITNFDASSGTAVISNDDTNWAVALFQDFTVQSLLASGNTLWLELDFSASVSGPFDFFVAELEDTTGGLLTLDISSGSIDITAWAGMAAGIVFYLQDDDFQTGDFLTIDNIRITQHEASVPEPTSLFLLLGAGLGLIASQRKFKA